MPSDPLTTNDHRGSHLFLLRLWATGDSNQATSHLESGELCCETGWDMVRGVASSTPVGSSALLTAGTLQSDGRYKGIVQHIVSGKAYSFSELSSLVDLLWRLLPAWETQGGDVYSYVSKEDSNGNGTGTGI